MRVLVIDDLRTFRPEVLDSDTEVVYARTPSEGLARLEEGGWNEIVLDHDLGRNLTTGQTYEIWPCVEFIEENRNSFREVKFYVVSSNAPGATAIDTALQVSSLNSWRLTEDDKAKYFIVQDS